MSKTKSSTSSSSDCMPTISKPPSSDYTTLRILQKNVVYVIGLSSSLANKNILSSWQFFGQYGHITKIVVNKSGYSQSFKNDTTYSAYVTYSSQEEAAIALLAIDNCVVDGHVIRGSFGTTKYCTFFLKGIECANKECLYLHQFGDEEDTVLKEEISGANKQLFCKHQKIAIKIADIFNKEKKQKYLSNAKYEQFIGERFPSVDSIYKKENIYELEKEIKIKSTYNDYDFNDNEEEIEYVLVREPNKKKRKWKNSNNRSNKFQIASHKAKPKYNLEDFKRRLLPSNQVTVSSPIKYSNTSGSTSKSSAKTASSNNSSYCYDRSNNLYRNPVKSRYAFANDEDEKEKGVDVPEFISDLIYLEMSSFTFYKKIGGFKDDLVMNEEVGKVIDWNNSVQTIVF